MMRSVSTSHHRFAHTGASQYKKGVDQIVKVAIPNPDADQISRLTALNKTVKVNINVQTEDLGDDGIKASNYGIANLKRIVPNLMKWTRKKGENYADLKTMYGHVLGQYGRYNGHVTTIVGGVIEDNKTADQAGAIYTQVTKQRQKAAVKFLNDQLFKTPTWVINKAIIERTESSGVSDRIKNLQTRTLRSLLSGRRMVRMIDNQTLNGSKAYTVLSMMSDVRRGIWAELYSRKAIDTYRRNLQRNHISVLGNLMSKGADISDVKPIVRGELNRIKRLSLIHI